MFLVWVVVKVTIVEAARHVMALWRFIQRHARSLSFARALRRSFFTLRLSRQSIHVYVIVIFVIFSIIVHIGHIVIIVVIWLAHFASHAL